MDNRVDCLCEGLLKMLSSSELSESAGIAGQLSVCQDYWTKFPTGCAASCQWAMDVPAWLNVVQVAIPGSQGQALCS